MGSSPGAHASCTPELGLSCNRFQLIEPRQPSLLHGSVEPISDGMETTLKTPLRRVAMHHLTLHFSMLLFISIWKVSAAESAIIDGTGTDDTIDLQDANGAALRTNNAGGGRLFDRFNANGFTTLQAPSIVMMLPAPTHWQHRHSISISDVSLNTRSMLTLQPTLPRASGQACFSSRVLTSKATSLLSKPNQTFR